MSVVNGEKKDERPQDVYNLHEPTWSKYYLTALISLKFHLM